ncbi:MAG: M20/M25/M40 family metallo-hydrolase, partial [Proteobacteria bacterium]
MIKLYACLPLCLAISQISAVSKPVEGLKGYARYTVKDSDTKVFPIKPGSEIFRVHPGFIEYLTPIDHGAELDTLGALSHEATGFCGSMDFYPLHYQMATEISHAPPYFAASAHFSELETIIADSDLNRMNDTITTLSSLPSRFHRHSSGQHAGQNVNSLWTAQLQNASSWSLSEFDHSATPQKSVIARLEGDTADTVVLGAHLDSITSRTNYEAPAPGADDDASGIAILTEILRIIETRNLKFHRSIELQGYAAEEVGLVGSREIASNYRLSNKEIDAMLQFDMAYYSRDADGGLLFFLEDFTSLDLTRNGISWVKTYMGDVYRRGAMPKGAASDHKSWFEQGYPTLFPFENALADNPYIHSTLDTMDKFDDGLRMQRMVKFGLLFLAYNAGLKSLDAPYNLEKLRLAAETPSKDLHLAITGSGGAYSFLVSAPAETEFLEFCQTNSA